MRKFEEVLLTDIEIQSLLDKGNYSEAAEYLLHQQLRQRPDVRKKYDELKNISIKKFYLNGHLFELHHNPARLTSTTASTDQNAVASRQCFLCINNLPAAQKGISYGDYIILVNPYPIFPAHFTIVHKEHTPQRINHSFTDMLMLVKALHPYLTIFYNGPECGASAPDHLHFQGAAKGYLPLEKEMASFISEGEVIYKDSCILKLIYEANRKIVFLEGNNPEDLTILFNKFLTVYSDVAPLHQEPLFNIVVIYDSGWKLIIFLREKHRPDLFYAAGDDKLTISPAAADLSGIIIAPVEKDFLKTNMQLLSDILEEVSLNKEKFIYLRDQLKARL